MLRKNTRFVENAEKNSGFSTSQNSQEIVERVKSAVDFQEFYLQVHTLIGSQLVAGRFQDLIENPGTVFIQEIKS